MPGQHQDGTVIALGAQYFDRFAAVHIGQTNIENGQINIVFARRLERVIGRCRLENLELGVDFKLLDQGLARLTRLVTYPE